jgi:hypothetical protein
MHVGKKNPGCPYTMRIKDEEYKMGTVVSEKDLGVTFDTDLKFDHHIQRVVTKANQMIGIIKRSFTYLDKNTFLKLYKAFVRPHVEYANVIWCPHLKRQSQAIEKIQRRATKLLTDCKDKSYGDRLRYLHLHSLKGRRIRGDLIQMFKIINKIEETNMLNYFSFDQTERIRNSEGKILIQYCKSNQRKYSFSHRVATNWNLLPSNVKFASSVNGFKNLLDSLPIFKNKFYEYD